jgi:hypothetical protein
MTAPPNAWPVPDGWRLVPEKLTDEMLEAIAGEWEEHFGFAEIYDSMLAAAPAPPVQAFETMTVERADRLLNALRELEAERRASAPPVQGPGTEDSADEDRALMGVRPVDFEYDTGRPIT